MPERAADWFGEAGASEEDRKDQRDEKDEREPGWQIANGRWQSGEWKIEDGKWERCLMLREGKFEEAGFVFGEGELEGEVAGGGGHFVPGFAEGVNHGIVGGLAGEVGELVLEEDEAESVFENAAFRILGEIFFEIESLDSSDDFWRVAEFAEDESGFVSVKFFEVVAPLEVAGLGHWILVARNHPAADVLGAGGQEQRLGCIWREAEDPIVEAMSIKKFARPLFSFYNVDVWVFGIFFVEAAQGAFEKGAVADIGRRR